MAYIADVMMIAQMTGSGRKGEPPSVEPLLKYLRNDRPFTGLLRKWFIELLDAKRTAGLRLTLSRRRGYHMSGNDVTKHAEAYYYVNELAGKNVTSQLCRLILQDLERSKVKGRQLRIERQGTKTSFHIQRNGDTEFSFIKNRKLPKDLAIRIAAKTFSRSASSIKKSIAGIDKARRES